MHRTKCIERFKTIHEWGNRLELVVSTKDPRQPDYEEQSIRGP